MEPVGLNENALKTSKSLNVTKKSKSQNAPKKSMLQNELKNSSLKNAQNHQKPNSTFNITEGSGELPESNTQTTDTLTTTSSESIRPIWNIKSKYNYTEVLHKSLLFYEAQRSGRLPENKRLAWTKSSALTDRGTLGEDLTGFNFLLLK